MKNLLTVLFLFCANFLFVQNYISFLRKEVILFCLFLVPFFAFGQGIDTILLAKVDSVEQMMIDRVIEYDEEELTSFCEKLNEVVIKNEGENSINIGTTCYCLGLAASSKNDLEISQTLIEKSLKIREKLNGNHHLYSKSLIALANIKWRMNDLESALKLYRQASQLYLETEGEESFLYLQSEINFGALLQQSAGLDEATKHLIQLEDKLLKESPEYQKLNLARLSILAEIFRLKGDYQTANKYYDRIIGIYEKNKFSNETKVFKLGYGSILRNSGELLGRLGKFEEAEERIYKAINILEQNFPITHLEMIAAKFDKACYLYAAKDYEKSKSNFLKLLPVIKEKGEKAELLYGKALQNVGNTCFMMGDPEEAEKFYFEALEFFKQKVGEDHPDLWPIYFVIAYIYKEKREFDEAEHFLLVAKKLIEKHFGKTSGHYTQAQEGFIDLYQAQKKYNKAKETLSESIHLRKSTQGTSSMRYLSDLNQLGYLNFVTEDFPNAEANFILHDSLYKKVVLNSVYHMTELEKQKMLTQSSPPKSPFFSILQKTDSKGNLTERAFNLNLFYRGFLSEAIIKLNKLGNENPEIKQQIDSLNFYKKTLGEELSKPVGSRDSSKIESLEEQVFQKEKKLVKSSKKFGGVIKEVDFKAVKENLKPDEAIIQFTDFALLDTTEILEEIYSALLVRGDSPQPKFFSLFNKKRLDSLLQLNQARRSDYVNDLYAYRERGAVAKDKPKKTLYELVWRPFEKELEDIKTVYLSASGLLHRINLGAIPIDDEIVLGDKYNFLQIGSARKLAIEEETDFSKNDAILFGGIQYEADSVAFALENEHVLSNSIASRNRGELTFSAIDTTSRGSSWNYLKWTKKEVESIAENLNESKFKTSMLTGYSASEEAFKTIGTTQKSPRVLHIATHGFFFPDPKTTNKSSEESTSFEMSDHPMIRSGLIMAGGNHVWTNKPKFEGREDGILTAYEISQMNLSNTELVVLSACETGLGDIDGNEGVYGLQRAFKIAGAKYLIMSLWQVPDRETKDFMVTFYRHWLEEKMSIPDAFRKTQQEMKERFYNPYQWAGFILVE